MCEDRADTVSLAAFTDAMRAAPKAVRAAAASGKREVCESVTSGLQGLVEACSTALKQGVEAARGGEMPSSRKARSRIPLVAMQLLRVLAVSVTVPTKVRGRGRNGGRGCGCVCQCLCGCG